MDLPPADASTQAASPIPAGLRLDAAGRLDEDVPCRRCGYDLRGQLPDGRCPECGTPVGRSLAGDLLRFCDPIWVGTLASGMNWIRGAIAFAIVVGGAAAVLLVASGAAGPSSVLFSLVMVAFYALSLVGYWRVTTPDPTRLEKEGQFSARRIIRFAQVALLAVVLLQFLAGGLIPVVSVLTEVLMWGAGLAGVVAIFLYARALARRIPDDKLARRCPIVMWGLVICLSTSFGLTLLVSRLTSGPTGGAGGTGVPTPLSCASGLIQLGYLVFLLWAVRLIERFRKAFREAAAQAAATWAAEPAARQQADLSQSP